MGDCCDPSSGYDAMFDDRFARRIAKRYHRKGLTKIERRLVRFLLEQGVEGATVLEIGGGVGEVQVELLRAGASRVTNLEISGNYEREASALLAANGFEGQVDRRILDIAAAPDEVEAADIVVLNRVVCCYPDYAALLGAAGAHAQRVLVYSHPPRTWLIRTLIGFDNLMRRLKRNDFRAFVHPPDAMIGVAQGQGLALKHRSHGWEWDVVGLTRA